MHSSRSPLAPERKAIHLLAGGMMFVLLMTAAVMVARRTLVASASEMHAAAAVRFPVAAVTQKPILTPIHKASRNLLPVVDQDDIQPRHRMLADQVLRSLPRQCRDHLKNFYVNYDQHAANRGLGGESTIIVIGTVPDREFQALIIHECGHVTDIGGLQGSMRGGNTSFADGNEPIYGDDASVQFYKISWVNPELRRTESKESDFVSGYASSDPFEDFSETYAYFALQKEAFRKLAAKNSILKAKYDFMEKIVFAGATPIAQGKYIPGKKVPWDVTKLPYVWHAKR